jgi:hypothetical protein
LLHLLGRVGSTLLLLLAFQSQSHARALLFPQRHTSLILVPTSRSVFRRDWIVTLRATGPFHFAQPTTPAGAARSRAQRRRSPALLLRLPRWLPSQEPGRSSAVIGLPTSISNALAHQWNSHEPFVSGSTGSEGNPLEGSRRSPLTAVIADGCVGRRAGRRRRWSGPVTDWREEWRHHVPLGLRLVHITAMLGGQISVRMRGWRWCRLLWLIFSGRRIWLFLAGGSGLRTVR